MHALISRTFLLSFSNVSSQAEHAVLDAGRGAQKYILDVLQKTFFVVMHDFLPTYM